MNLMYLMNAQIFFVTLAFFLTLYKKQFAVGREMIQNLSFIRYPKLKKINKREMSDERWKI